jgi:hypothetical protein
LVVGVGVCVVVGGVVCCRWCNTTDNNISKHNNTPTAYTPTDVT